MLLKDLNNILQEMHPKTVVWKVLTLDGEREYTAEQMLIEADKYSDVADKWQKTILKLAVETQANKLKYSGDLG